MQLEQLKQVSACSKNRKTQEISVNSDNQLRLSISGMNGDRAVTNISQQVTNGRQLIGFATWRALPHIEIGITNPTEQSSDLKTASHAMSNSSNAAALTNSSGALIPMR